VVENDRLETALGSHDFLADGLEYGVRIMIGR
jgi:hypothetical protein